MIMVPTQSEHDVLARRFATENKRYDRVHWVMSEQKHAKAKACKAQMQVLKLMPLTDSFRVLLPGAMIKKTTLTVEYDDVKLGTCIAEWKPIPQSVLAMASTSNTTVFAPLNRKRKLEAEKQV